MASPDVDRFLSRDDSRLIETLSAEIVAHVSVIDAEVFGYAILTGNDTSVEDLMCAYDRNTPKNDERFDVHAWEMCPGCLDNADDVLAELNEEFNRLYPTDPTRSETDEIEDAHVAKLHESIIAAMLRAQQQNETLRSEDVFCIFTIPDSLLEIDLRASKLLNSDAIHTRYAAWR
jgi:hypothetical protein